MGFTTVSIESEEYRASTIMTTNSNSWMIIILKDVLPE